MSEHRTTYIAADGYASDLPKLDVLSVDGYVTATPELLHLLVEQHAAKKDVTHVEGNVSVKIRSSHFRSFMESVGFEAVE